MKRERRNRFEVVIYADDGARLQWRTRPGAAPTVIEIVASLQRVIDALSGAGDGNQHERRDAVDPVGGRGEKGPTRV